MKTVVQNFEARAEAVEGVRTPEVFAQAEPEEDRGSSSDTSEPHAESAPTDNDDDAIGAGEDWLNHLQLPGLSREGSELHFESPLAVIGEYRSLGDEADPFHPLTSGDGGGDTAVAFRSLGSEPHLPAAEAVASSARRMLAIIGSNDDEQLSELREALHELALEQAA